MAVVYRVLLSLAGRPHNSDESVYSAGVTFFTEGHLSFGAWAPSAVNRPLHLAVYWICDRLFGHYPWLALDVAHALIIGIAAWLLAVVCAQLTATGSRRLPVSGPAMNSWRSTISRK